MREIKFRVLTINNEWKYFMLNDLVMGDAIPHDDLQLKPETWSQYTGLKDKNGTEIYEGDIVEYHPYVNLGHIHEKQIRPVVWDETGDSDGYAHYKHYEWTCGEDSLADVADSDFKNSMYCKVIGNLYENPDLLELKL